MQTGLVFDEETIREINNNLQGCETLPCKVKANEASREEVVSRASVIASRGYRFSPASLEALKAYLEGYSILLGGDVGVGKTMFFERVNPAPIPAIALTDLAMLKVEEINQQVESLQDKEVVIDDVGAEPIYNNYGCKMDLLPWIIERRLKSSCRTHYTTNLSSRQIYERYGARVADRLVGQCKAFRLSGSSHRCATPNAKLMEQRLSADWRLCSERGCIRCRYGYCDKGVRVPPNYRDRPIPPEECEFFKRR